jgi:hypothetical protein
MLQGAPRRYSVCLRPGPKFRRGTWFPPTQ